MSRSALLRWDRLELWAEEWDLCTVWTTPWREVVAAKFKVDGVCMGRAGLLLKLRCSLLPDTA